MTILVTDERVVSAVRQVAEEEARALPDVTAASRERAYLDMLRQMAERGEPLPATVEELRQLRAARLCRAFDRLRAVLRT